MASKIVTANTAVQTAASQVKNARHVVKSLLIDNKAGAADRVINIQDGFTPDESAGVASPTAKAINRWQATVLQGSVDSYNEDDLAGINCIGSLGIIADAIDANCAITVGFKDE